MNAGKSPVGFLNPTLYSNPQILNDITNGTNIGCGVDGFAAVKGWVSRMASRIMTTAY
jgi:tripeptidyl-peptidase-1